MIVPGSQIRSDSELRVIHVTLVMANGPFGGFLGTNRIGPTESHNTRTDSDAKPSGFRLDTATPRPTGPWSRRLEQRRSGGDHLGRSRPTVIRATRRTVPE
jgi:hypothetical protein